MPKEKVHADELDGIVREHLRNEGYQLLRPKKPVGAGGADIVALKGDEQICIEVISYKLSGQARARDFFQAFWQAISRLEDPRTRRCVIALDYQSKGGLPARVDLHREGWKRIGEAFPELEIWFVNREVRTIEKHRWSECLNIA